MRLGFVVQRYGPDVLGGAESYVRRMATGLVAEGHEVTVVSSCATSYADWANDYPPGVTVEDGVTVHRLAVRNARANERFIPLHLRMVDAGDLPLWPWAQDRWSQIMGPDLLGAETVLPELAATVDVTIVVGYHYAHSLHLLPHVATNGPTMLVPTAHPEGAFHVGWVRQMFDNADLVLCLAPEEAELVDRAYQCGARTVVVPCPVDDLPWPDRATVDSVAATYGLEPGRYATVVGRLDPAKGSDDAIRFTGEYRRAVDPTFELAVIGPGEANVHADGVITTGFVDEATKVALVAGSQVLVQPSYMESFSLSLMESWLLERPALVQRRSGVLAGHVTRSGGGVAYGDYLDFEAALTTVRTHAEIADQLGGCGRSYVRREFDWSVVAPLFMAAAEQAAEAGRRRLNRERTRS